MKLVKEEKQTNPLDDLNFPLTIGEFNKIESLAARTHGQFKVVGDVLEGFFDSFEGVDSGISAEIEIIERIFTEAYDSLNNLSATLR